MDEEEDSYSNLPSDEHYYLGRVFAPASTPKSRKDPTICSSVGVATYSKTVKHTVLYTHSKAHTLTFYKTHASMQYMPLN